MSSPAALDVRPAVICRGARPVLHILRRGARPVRPRDQGPGRIRRSGQVLAAIMLYQWVARVSREDQTGEARDPRDPLHTFKERLTGTCMDSIT